MCIVYTGWNLFSGLEYHAFQCQKCKVLQVKDKYSHRKTRRSKNSDVSSTPSTRFVIHNFFIYCLCFGLLFQTVLCTGDHPLLTHLKPGSESSSSSSSPSSSSSSSSPSSSSSSSNSGSDNSLGSGPNRPGGCPIDECQETAKYFFEEDCKGYRTIVKCLSQAHIQRPCHGYLIFRTWQSMVTNKMRRLKCASEGPDYWTSIALPEPPRPVEQWRGLPPQCAFHGDREQPGDSLRPAPVPPPDVAAPVSESHYVVCGLFGHAHLLTYRAEPSSTDAHANAAASASPSTEGLLQTCSLGGAWPLLDNRFVTVQVTARRDPRHGSSLFSQVTIIIKGYLECIPGAYQSYTLLAGAPLASTLDNGDQQVGHAVLRVREPGRHVQLELRHIGTVFSIRLLPLPPSKPKPKSKSKLSNSTRDDSDAMAGLGLLSIAARLPRQLVESQPGRRPLEPQLCATGCPRDLRLDERRAMTRSAASGRARTVALALAEEACRREGLRDSYLDACVFDAVLGRPPGGVQLAAGALADLRQLSPGLAAALGNRTHYRPYPAQEPRAPAAAPSLQRGAAALLSLCAFLALVVPAR